MTLLSPTAHGEWVQRCLARGHPRAERYWLVAQLRWSAYLHGFATEIAYRIAMAQSARVRRVVAAVRDCFNDELIVEWPSAAGVGALTHGGTTSMA